MGIDLGGVDVGVAQQRLHHAQLRAAFQQVGGEGVAKQVWVHRPVNTRRQRVLADDELHRSLGEAAAVAIQEERRRWTLRKPGTPFGQVSLHGAGGGPSHQHLPLSRTLAEHSHRPVF